MNDTKIASKAKAQLSNFMGKGCNDFFLQKNQKFLDIRTYSMIYYRI